MRYNHLYEQDIQNRWFRGIAVVWEIAMKEKAPVLCVDGASADAQSLKFLEFLKAARLMHKGELWPLVEKDLGLFVHKYKKSLKENC